MEQYIKLIHRISGSFHLTTGLDPDDLFQEAVLGYLEAMRTYCPDRGKITTYIWHCVTNALRNYVKQEKKYNTPLVEIEELNTQFKKSSHLFELLSQEGHQLASLIMECPEEYDILSPSEAISLLGRQAHREGMHWKKIWIGVHDLKSIFK